MISLSKEHISKTAGVCGGKACIAGTRIRVLDVVSQVLRGGKSVLEFVSVYPQVSVASVHAALAYYYDFTEEIEESIRREKRIADEYEAKFVSKRTHGVKS